MKPFTRFPHTPHLAWLGYGEPRDDKLLSKGKIEALLSDEVVVEEKLDGANIGFSSGPAHALQIQNRGQYLIPPYSGQFSRLPSWLGPRQAQLTDVLDPSWILFGEWCAARHSLEYDHLPDWFLVFDVFDRDTSRFWSTRRRDGLANELELAIVPRLFSGRATLSSLKELVMEGKSSFRDGPLEGIVVRQENADWLEGRAKLVRPDFTQTITEHWSRRRLEWNRLDHTSTK